MNSRREGGGGGQGADGRVFFFIFLKNKHQISKNIGESFPWKTIIFCVIKKMWKMG